jgi:hypothetical protein
VRGSGVKLKADVRSGESRRGAFTIDHQHNDVEADDKSARFAAHVLIVNTRETMYAPHNLPRSGP